MAYVDDLKKWQDQAGAALKAVSDLIANLPFPPGSPPPPPPSTKFALGDKVQSRVVSPNTLHVRATPAGTITGDEAPNALGTVTGGPEIAVLNGNSVIWWTVKWDDGLAGWSSEALMDKAEGPAPPPPPPPGPGPATGQALWCTTEYPDLPTDWDAARRARYNLHIFQSSVPGSSVVDKAFVDGVRALSPKAKILVYIFPQISWGFPSEFKPEWGIKVNGQQVINPGDTNMNLMDISNPDYRKFVLAQIMSVVNGVGFDGVFNDGLWPTADLGQDWVGWKPTPPQNVITSWKGWSLTFFQEIKAALGSKLLITNTTALDFDSDSAFLSIVDGTMMEGFVHAPWEGKSSYMGADQLLFEQKIAQRNLAAGKYFLTLSGSDSDFALPETQRWRDMSLASYLLFADGKYAHYTWGDFGATVPQLDIGATLGEATGPAVQAGNIWTRQFKGGKVTVDVQAGTAAIG